MSLLCKRAKKKEWDEPEEKKKSHFHLHKVILTLIKIALCGLI